jgi:hypothetical protein
MAAIALSPAALAGTNGQQVSFRAFDDISRVKISGDNYKGLPVTWDSERAGFTCTDTQCDEVRASNWWFKGKATVEYKLKDKRVAHNAQALAAGSSPSSFGPYSKDVTLSLSSSTPSSR